MLCIKPLEHHQTYYHESNFANFPSRFCNKNRILQNPGRIWETKSNDEWIYTSFLELIHFQIIINGQFSKQKNKKTTTQKLTGKIHFPIFFSSSTINFIVNTILDNTKWKYGQNFAFYNRYHVDYQLHFGEYEGVWE